MATIPTNKVGMHRQGVTQNARVCGQCGVLVAQEHVARHIAWHAQAAWTQVTVADDGTGAN
jgi:hypothetical protein